MRAVLVLNAGSSSVKFQICGIEGGTPQPRIRGQIEGIGVRPALSARHSGGEVLVERRFEPAKLPDLPAASRALGRWLAGLEGYDIRAIGHRVVHGGMVFDRPARLDADTIRGIEALAPLAPLHQPHNLAMIRLAAETWPGVPQVACFDTAFHRHRPPEVACYALPRAFYDEGIRRYGFHGISYEYVVGELTRIAPELARARVIAAHLGSGASMCAIKGGRSIESTMGFTALDGVPMGTRAGQIDPGVLLHLLEARGMSVGELADLLYRRSGLLGLSGVSNDMRELLASADPAAAFAIDHFVHRVALHAGELAAALGGLDAFVFTAGLGERSAPIRARIAARLGWLGAELDPAANDPAASGARRISTPGSRVALFVIPTDEELMIARATLALLPAQVAHEGQDIDMPKNPLPR